MQGDKIFEVIDYSVAEKGKPKKRTVEAISAHEAIYRVTGNRPALARMGVNVWRASGKSNSAIWVYLLKETIPLTRSQWEAEALRKSKVMRKGLIQNRATYPISNPPETKIYERVCEIVAIKGPGHKCDAACKRARHTYRHTFSKKHNIGVYGSPDSKKIILK